ncbi:CapA family protein [Proteiniclasticum ruminis]|uniref:Poly-gamma-glutamate synthesis protein (Capsule biosynthesis protein) n=1 Tax=Proteiniclasticum ruminis TaxID=398199 RepID=A0A1I4Y878_9CLOT|nr:CapA family protein [Proteiniclasticum ruminis]SFN33769.1 poly-gamma-glutamate synthesis protein (capsule biosynthesis protein) [Proteiniclasticum ruminis]
MQKYKTYLLSTSILISLMILASHSLGKIAMKETTAASPPSSEVKKEAYPSNHGHMGSQTLLITAVGDIMVHESQWHSQKTPENSYDFTNNFTHISPYIKASDLAFANFESTILQGIPLSSYPVFNSPPEILAAMKEAGFTHISTANNHSMDTGYKGIQGTLNAMYEQGLIPLGTYETGKKKSFHIETVQGIKLGIASYATGYFSGNTVTVNSIQSNGLERNINFIHMTDPHEAFLRIREDLLMMKDASVEAIILLLHWGTEYASYPSSFQKTLARLLIDEGVHLIIGSHPHLLQEMEVVTSSDGHHEGLVLYSLGNFLSNQREEILGIPGTEEGAIARVLLEKNAEGLVKIKEGTILPTWVHRREVSPDKKIYTYEILPLLASPEETAEKYHAPLTTIRKRHHSIHNTFPANQLFFSENN